MNYNRCFHCDRTLGKGTTTREIEDGTVVEFCGRKCANEFDHRDDKPISLLIVESIQPIHLSEKEWEKIPA